MELQEIVNIVKDLSWPAAIVVVAILMVRFITPFIPVLVDKLRSRLPKNLITSGHEQDIRQIRSDVETVKTNHLHEVVDLLKDIKAGQERVEGTLSIVRDNVIWLKARQNGGK